MPASAGPRMLIFGGSASVFGLDAELIQQKLGIGTVNFRHSRGPGTRFSNFPNQEVRPKGRFRASLPGTRGYGDGPEPTEYLREYAFSFEKSYVFSLKPKVMLSFLF